MVSDRQKHEHPVALLIYNYLYIGDNIFGYLQEDGKFMLEDGTFVTISSLHKKHKFKAITQSMLRDKFDENYRLKKDIHKRR